MSDGEFKDRDVMPSADLLQELLASEDSSPVVMVNLMKIKNQTELDRYVQMVGPIIVELGGSFEFARPVAGNVVGDADWDMIALVRYPSRRAFAEMQLSDEYAEVARHRIAGLDRADVFVVNG